MAQHRLMVLSNAVEGRDEEYNTWYDQTHIAEVLRVPGFVACQRFALQPVTAAGSAPPPQQYLAIYEIEGVEPAEALANLTSAVRDMNMSDAIDRKGVSAWVYSALGDRVAVDAVADVV